MKNPIEQNWGILLRIAGHARLRQATTNIYDQEFVPTKRLELILKINIYKVGIWRGNMFEHTNRVFMITTPIIIRYLLLEHLGVSSWAKLVLVSLRTEHRQTVVSHIPSKDAIISFKKYQFLVDLYSGFHVNFTKMIFSLSRNISFWCICIEDFMWIF